MIDFRCQCGEELSVPGSEAGGMLQCPRCRRLNDVPSLSELGQIESDGGFAMDSVPLAPEPERVSRVTRAFTRSTRNSRGEEIDLRPTLEEFLVIGEIPADAPPERKISPKYDPITGELIRDLEIKPDFEMGADGIPIAAIPVAAIPMAQPVINYANASTLRRVSFGMIAVELFKPVNVFVMGIVFVAHILISPIHTLLFANIFFVAPLAIAVWILFIAHYAIVIEEVGPGELDDLPRPLRDVSLSMDIWRPFWQFAGAFMIAYVPAMLALHYLPPRMVLTTPIVLALTLMGAFFFPAIALTTVTAGSLLNLRPDRVVGLIMKIGISYLLPVALFALAIPLYLYGMFGPVLEIAMMFVPASASAAFNANRPVWMSRIVFATALPAAIYVMHYSCWALGAFYRAHYADFPWVLQRHISTRRDDTMKLLEKRRFRNRVNAAKQASSLRQ